MGIRRTRLDLRMADQRVSRRVNGKVKTKERVRRHARIRDLIKTGTFPYTSPVRAYLSQSLGIPASKLTPEDVQKFLAQA